MQYQDLPLLYIKATKVPVWIQFKNEINGKARDVLVCDNPNGVTFIPSHSALEYDVYIIGGRTRLYTEQESVHWKESRYLVSLKEMKSVGCSLEYELDTLGRVAYFLKGYWIPKRFCYEGFIR